MTTMMTMTTLGLEGWRLEDYDFAIIAILLVAWLLTIAWRVFFRWDSLHGLKQRGMAEGAYRAFYPPFPVEGAPGIVVLEQSRWNPRRRATWLVQGLLGAGFRVLLGHVERATGAFPTMPASLAMQTGSEIPATHGCKACEVVIHHGTFREKAVPAVAMHLARAAGTDGTSIFVLVNEGGSRGLKAIIDLVEHDVGMEKVFRFPFYLITGVSKHVPRDWFSCFRDTLVVRRHAASLQDVELQAVGIVLKWVGM